MTESLIGHEFEVSGIAIKGTPVASSVFNELDSHGVALNLPRLPLERNDAYKKRLLDVFARRASSTYIGLLNAMTRELGLEYSKPITIELDSATPTNIQPVIEFIENKVFIYSNKATSTLEMEINRSTPGVEGYWLGDLVNKINTESAYFNLTLASGQEPFTRSDTIINQSSSKIVNNFLLRDSNIQVLPNQNIEKNSLVFTDRLAFNKEVNTEVEVTAQGCYFVDYVNGVIKTFSVPPEGVRARYNFHETSFSPVASPVIIRDLQSEIFKELLFSQTVNYDGSQTSGIPTDLGALIINELMSVYPMYFGV